MSKFDKLLHEPIKRIYIMLVKEIIERIDDDAAAKNN